MRCDKCAGLCVHTTWSAEGYPLPMLRCVNCGRVRFGRVRTYQPKELADYVAPALWPIEPRKYMKHAHR